MQEMINFLGQIPSLPWVIQDTTALTMPITSLEISDAIASLWPSKSPGCDGLNAEFYKALKESLVPVLVKVFEQI